MTSFCCQRLSRPWSSIRPSDKRIHQQNNNNKIGDEHQLTNMCDRQQQELSPTMTDVNVADDVDRKNNLRDGVHLKGGKKFFALCAPFVGMLWIDAREDKKRRKSVWENFHGRVRLFPHVHLFVCFPLYCWPNNSDEKRLNSLVFQLATFF